VTSTRSTAFVGIGSNLGDARSHVQHAIEELDRLGKTKISGRSSLFRTAPLDADGDDYVNAVARLETELTALQLLLQLQALEQAAGRQRPYPNAPRTLDLDLLLYGQEQISSEFLTVPHPRMTQRAFVVIPLLQIDPLLVIPGQGPLHMFVPAMAGQSIQKIPS
jgi:2-amino-4-hydroxy-6-hydroxymethyldihydropteridine diphosphokinase